MTTPKVTPEELQALAEKLLTLGKEDALFDEVESSISDIANAPEHPTHDDYDDLQSEVIALRVKLKLAEAERDNLAKLLAEREG